MPVAFFLTLVLSVLWQLCLPSSAMALTTVDEVDLINYRVATLVSTPSAEASSSGVVQKRLEKRVDITQPEPATLGELEKYLAQNPIQPLNVTNFLQHAVRSAVKNGVPANTLVLLLLFPLVSAVVAFSRHYIGLEGFGIFTPAIISVAFSSTGIVSGLILLLGIIIASTLGRVIMRKIKLLYLPRMALSLWFVSLGVLSLIFLAPLINLAELATVSIFPILILVLLAESFIKLQNKTNLRQALYKTLTTVVIALTGYWLMNWEFMQKLALLHTELLVIGVAVFDYGLGKFTGLRLLEYRRFRSILRT